MCLRTCYKRTDRFTISDRSWTSSPQFRGSSTKSMTTPKPLTLLRGTSNWQEILVRNVWTLVLSWCIYISHIFSNLIMQGTIYKKRHFLFSTGSHCNDYRTGVVCANFHVPVCINHTNMMNKLATEEVSIVQSHICVFIGDLSRSNT